MNIGYISLDIASTIYIIWLLPQLTLNFKRKNTEGLSIVMHGILCVGYLCDLLYGFGLGMQWQYKTVTIAGLCSLTVQHYQFGRYGLRNRANKYIYAFLTTICLLVFTFAIISFNTFHQSRNFYDAMGMITNVCWFSYMLPQIIKNYVNKSTAGLSAYFVLLALFLSLCDATSAWSLGWDYPSKVGPIISFLGNSFLLFQVFYLWRAQQSILVSGS